MTLLLPKLRENNLSKEHDFIKLLIKLRENNLSEEHDFITHKVEREQFVQRT